MQTPFEIEAAARSLAAAGGNWSAQQLAEFTAALAGCSDEAALCRIGVERAAEALECEVCALVLDASIVEAVGYPRGRMPDLDILAAASGDLLFLEVPGAGACRTVSAGLDGENGGFVLARSGTDPFSQEEASLLRCMARVFSLALRGNRTLATERRLREESQQLAASLGERQALLERLVTIGRSISHREGLGRVLASIVHGARDLIGDEAAGLRVLDPDDPSRTLLVVSVGLPDDVRDEITHAPVEMGSAGRAICEDRVVIIDDVAVQDVLAPFARSGLRSTMAAPVRQDGRPVGALVVGSPQPGRRYTEAEREILLAFAEHAAIALMDAQTVEAVRRSEARYRDIVETAQEGIWVLDASGRTSFANRRLAEMLGRDAVDLAGAAVTDHLDARTWTRLEARLRSGGTPQQVEAKLQRTDGAMLWTLMSTSPLTDGSGRYTGALAMVTDITERKAGEVLLREAYEREREAGERLRSLDQMKNAILTAVSHELRTPLTVILGLAKTLRRLGDELSPEQHDDFLGRLETQSRRLERMLSDLLDVDRLSRGIVEPRRAPTELNGLVSRIVAETHLAEHRPIHIDVDAGAFHVDAAKVERILENLLVNAHKYTPPASPVWIRARAAPEGLLLTVEDDGPGVPPDLRELIFQPFRQGTAGGAHAPGVGIGLSLVAGFAELHGGRAWVEDRPGGGAAFKVLLPAGSSQP